MFNLATQAHSRKQVEESNHIYANSGFIYGQASPKIKMLNKITNQITMDSNEPRTPMFGFRNTVTLPVIAKIVKHFFVSCFSTEVMSQDIKNHKNN